MRSLRLDDPEYPARLADLKRPPHTLYVRGDLRCTGPSVAIVGARRASEEGRMIARRIAAQLAERGVLVVSGGALGIDAAAHEGALAGGGRTWVVLPTPIDSPGPKQNRALFDRILEGGGAWCSKLLEPGGRSAFRERNDIVAALADLTLVVEARDPSGTRYTADAARRIGRPLWVVPWAMTDPRGSGARALIPKGANVLATTADLLRALDVPVAAPRRRRAKPSGSLDASILARLRDEPASAEALCTQLRTPLAPILTALTTLELSGLVEERGGRFFVP